MIIRFVPRLHSGDERSYNRTKSCLVTSFAFPDSKNLIAKVTQRLLMNCISLPVPDELL